MNKDERIIVEGLIARLATLRKTLSDEEQALLDQMVTSTDPEVVFHAMSEGALSEGTIAEGALAEGAVSEGALSEGALSEEALASEVGIHSMSEGAMSEGALSEGALSEGALSEGALSEGAMSEDALASEVGIHSMSEGALAEGALSEGAMSEGALAEGALSEGALTEESEVEMHAATAGQVQDKAVAGNPARPYSTYSEILARNKEVALSSTIFKKEEIENGAIKINDIIKTLENKEVAFIRGIPKQDPYYINTNIEELRSNALQIYNTLFKKYLINHKNN